MRQIRQIRQMIHLDRLDQMNLMDLMDQCSVAKELRLGDGSFALSSLRHGSRKASTQLGR
jgi:hypothetical protein